MEANDMDRGKALRAMREAIQQMGKLPGDNEDLVVVPLRLLKQLVPDCVRLEVRNGNEMEIVKLNELPIPANAKANPKSFEFVRAWDVGDDLLVSLRINPEWGPVEWAVHLAIIGRHAVNAMHGHLGGDKDAIMRELVKEFVVDFAIGKFNDKQVAE